MFGQMSRKATAAVAALAMGAVMAPAALAQSYGAYGSSYGYGQSRAYGQSYGQTYYDPCVRDQRERQTAGGLLGAAIGAIAGSQVAARGRRTEGSVLGGVVGAAVGAGVGRGQAACDSRGYGGYPPPPAPYGSQGGYAYDDRYAPPDDYDRRHDGRYDDRYAAPVNDYRYSNTDECRLAESRIRLPDGREEVRYVRTCPDQNGRYRVVD